MHGRYSRHVQSKSIRHKTFIQSLLADLNSQINLWHTCLSTHLVNLIMPSDVSHIISHISVVHTFLLLLFGVVTTLWNISLLQELILRCFFLTAIGPAISTSCTPAISLSVEVSTGILCFLPADDMLQQDLSLRNVIQCYYLGTGQFYTTKHAL